MPDCILIFASRRHASRHLTVIISSPDVLDVHDGLRTCIVINLSIALVSALKLIDFFVINGQFEALPTIFSHQISQICACQDAEDMISTLYL